MAETQIRVLVCVDASQISEKAFKWYLNNFYNPNSKLVLCHVPEFWGNVQRMMSPAKIKEMVEETHINTKQVQQKYDQLCKEFGVDATFEVLHGPEVWHEICKFAEENNVQSIVVGTRGMGMIKRALLGSVSSGILHHAHIPVLIYKDH